MYLLERGPKYPVELTTWAQKYTITHTCTQQLGGNSKATVQGSEGFVNTSESEYPKEDLCHGGSIVYRWRRGEEEHRTKKNLKKSGTEGSTNTDSMVYSAVCRAQSNDGHTYVGVGRWMASEGTTRYRLYRMIVERTLVPDVMLLRFVADGVPYLDRRVIFQCLFGFPVLQRTLQGDMCELCFLSHTMSGPWVRFVLLASIKINSNMSESLHQLCDHPCVNCITLRHLSPTKIYVFYCAKNDSVQTQWTQGLRNKSFFCGKTDLGISVKLNNSL